MKKIFIFALVLIMSCVSTSKIKEDVLYKTKIYAGHYISSSPIDDQFTAVMTDYGYFRLKENPEIPDSSLCYIRVQYSSYDFHPDIAEQMAVKYFTWNGADLEYRIFNNIKTRRR